eukprot:scaffold526375_cov15-Prasinocladus_malaysianus.AAC.1
MTRAAGCAWLQQEAKWETNEITMRMVPHPYALPGVWLQSAGRGWGGYLLYHQNRRSVVDRSSPVQFSPVHAIHSIAFHSVPFVPLHSSCRRFRRLCITIPVPASQIRLKT